MHAFTGAGDGGVTMRCNRNKGVIVRCMPSPRQEMEDALQQKQGSHSEMPAFTGAGDGGIIMCCNRDRGVIVRCMPSPGQDMEE